MYINYSKLWQLLAEKDLSKSEKRDGDDGYDRADMRGAFLRRFRRYGVRQRKRRFALSVFPFLRQGRRRERKRKEARFYLPRSEIRRLYHEGDRHESNADQVRG